MCKDPMARFCPNFPDLLKFVGTNEARLTTCPTTLAVDVGGEDFRGILNVNSRYRPKNKIAAPREDHSQYILVFFFFQNR